MLKQSVNPASAVKQILLFITALMLIVAYSQEPVVKPIDGNTLIEKDGLKYEPSSDEPYSGEAVWYYENGQKKRVENYEDGKVEGILISWYEDGQKKITGASKDGKPDGMWTEWYKDGQKKEVGTFRDGRKEGMWTYWYENGQKKEVGTLKDGRPDGKSTAWYENGQKKYDRTIKNLHLEGKAIEWYENGQKRSEKVYVGGKQDGKHTVWYANGQIKEKGYFNEGLMNGEWTYYHENGGVKGKGHFVDGDGTDINELSGIPQNGKDGYWEYYYENGQKWSIENYKEGRKHGPDITWYENGKKKIETAFKDGKKDGKYSVWHENGNKMLEINLKDGKEQGKLTQWYENGQKQVESTFINGEETGSFTFWYENGQIRTEGILEAGLTEGEWTRYYENGVVKWSGQYIGVDIENLGEDWGSSTKGRNGLWIFNNENGKRHSEQTYKDGQLEGFYSEWFDNGEKKYEGNYSNNRMEGDWTFYDEQGTVKEDLSQLVTNYYAAMPGLRTFKIAKQGSVKMGDMISTDITEEILVDLDQRKFLISATQEMPEFGGMYGGEVNTEVYLTTDTVYLYTLGETMIVTDEEIRAEAGIGLDALWNILEAESPTVFINEATEDILSIEDSEGEGDAGIGTELALFSSAELSDVILEEEPCYLLTVDSSYASELADIMGRLLETEEDTPEILDKIDVSDFVYEQWISRETFYDMKVHTRIILKIEGDEMSELGFFSGEEGKIGFNIELTADISEHNQPMEIIMPTVNIQPTFFQPDLPPAPFPEPVLTAPEFPSHTETSVLGQTDYNWSFHTLEGEEVQLSKFEDRVIFLNLWATWCKPCRIEMPGIQNLYDELKDEEVVFLLASNENEETVRDFIEKEPYSFPVYLFGEDLPDVFKTRGIPATFIINRNGKIVFKHMGAAKWDDESCLLFIRSLK